MDDFSVIAPKPVVTKTLLNVIAQAITDLDDEQYKQRFSKTEIQAMKMGIDARLVLEYASEKYKLVREHFSVTSDNKILDKRLNKKPVTVIDFLVKTCNVRFSVALVELYTIYEHTRENSREYDRGYPM